MTDLLQPTWLSEDLPVLLAAVELTDAEGPTEAHRLCAHANLPIETVHRALVRLNGSYLVANIKRLADGGILVAFVQDVTASGRRASGQWPDPDRITADVLTRLERLADDQPPEKRENLRGFLSGLGPELIGTAVGSAFRAAVGG